ncbi:hypothetical protein LCGC14_1953850, partial [marine sediment metagenome]
LHSPGGLPEATDSLVEIVRSKFRHIRFIIPSVAKSAATMFALSGDKLLMERSAELGPIDPQFNFETWLQQSTSEGLVTGFYQEKTL